MLRTAGETGMHRITILVNEICETGRIPKNFCKSIINAIPKKQEAQIAAIEHRAISLISHVMKPILKVLSNRVKVKIKVYIGIYSQVAM